MICLDDKFVAVYFSAHFCPPCRAFTPRLAAAYTAGLSNKLNVIFVSKDRDEHAFNEYYTEMPWFALPYADRARASALFSRFGVETIPHLVVLKPDGSVFVENGYDLFNRDPTGSWLPQLPRSPALLHVPAVPGAATRNNATVPSGMWTGFYEHNGKRHVVCMTITIDRDHNQISGSGSDGIGLFYVNGQLTGAGKCMEFVKQYSTGSKPVQYKGWLADENFSFEGSWGIAGADTGSFYIRPAQYMHGRVQKQGFLAQGNDFLVCSSCAEAERVCLEQPGAVMGYCFQDSSSQFHVKRHGTQFCPSAGWTTVVMDARSL